MISWFFSHLEVAEDVKKKVCDLLLQYFIKDLNIQITLEPIYTQL